MINKKIVENNKLIAEFLKKAHNKICWKLIPKNTIHLPEYFKYHNSWDWLMPVVEKLEKKYCSTNIHYYSGGHFKQQTVVEFVGYTVDCDIIAVNKNKIDAVYEAVVKFIKAYNSNFKS